MLHQLGIILIFIIAALIIFKSFKNNENTDLIYEDEMDDEELKKIDDELD